MREKRAFSDHCTRIEDDHAHLPGLVHHVNAERATLDEEECLIERTRLDQCLAGQQLERLHVVAQDLPLLRSERGSKCIVARVERDGPDKILNGGACRHESTLQKNGGRVQESGAVFQTHYLPMQKREKITPSKSSAANSPVISLSAFCARRNSSASRSKACAWAARCTPASCRWSRARASAST